METLSSSIEVEQIAMMDRETGDYNEHRLKRRDGEAEEFYRDLKWRAVKVRVGLEATGIGDGSNDC